MSKYTYNTKEQIKIFQTNWLNVLPDIENMDVLKVGTNKRDNLITINCLNPKSLCCIGRPVVDLVGIVKKYYNSINDVPSEAYDLLLIDEPEYISSAKSFEETKKMLLKMSQILKENGTLLICFPNGWFSVKYKYWVEKALFFTRLNKRNYFFCDPSPEYPLVIVPYSVDPSWLIARLPNIEERALNIKERLKNVMKKVIFNVTKRYYPFRGLVLVAEKSLCDGLRNKYFLDEIMKVLIDKNELIKNTKTMMICVTASHLQRFYLFIYNMLNNNLLMVIKVGLTPYRHIFDVGAEHERLIIVSKCKKLFDEKNIKIPRPIHSESLAGRDISIQSAVQGKSVDWLLSKYNKKNNKEAVLKTLYEIAGIQIYLQDVCNKNIISSVSIINNDLLYNYMNISYDWEKQDRRLYLDHVQHGDFTVNNIFFDKNTNSWGIIDWEGMNRGFPPLFDLFSLFTSYRFPNMGPYSDMFDMKYHSFIRTYFCENWFTDHLRNLVENYCAHFNLARESVYSYFIAFLLFRCNKYRIYVRISQFQKLHEKMLISAVNNRERFVLK